MRTWEICQESALLRGDKWRKFEEVDWLRADDLTSAIEKYKETRNNSVDAVHMGQWLKEELE